jgi:hypothetical protein
MAASIDLGRPAPRTLCEMRRDHPMTLAIRSRVPIGPVLWSGFVALGLRRPPGHHPWGI